jgi:hypothetical protein
MNYRMLPPTGVAYQTRVVNGRTYSGTPGQIVTVPSFDGDMLSANGWIFVSLSGPTSSRPTATSAPQPAQQGLHYFDETLNKEIVFDGGTWRDPATGNSV